MKAYNFVMVYGCRLDVVIRVGVIGRLIVRVSFKDGDFVACERIMC